MYIHGQNPPDRSGWGQISDQFDVNDCDNSVLNAYPEPRRFFCIDHGMGQVMVSSRFSVPAVQTTYTIQVDVSPDGATKFRQEYNVTYFKTTCDYSFFLYSDIIHNHDCDDRFKLGFKFRADFDATSVYTAIDLASTAYMIDVSYNQSLLPGHVDDFTLEYDNHAGSVIVKNLTDVRFIEPVGLNVGRNLFTVKILNKTSQSPVIVNSLGWGFILMYASNFCENSQCIEATQYWITEEKRWSTVGCFNDLVGYRDKYGLCQGENKNISGVFPLYLEK